MQAVEVIAKITLRDYMTEGNKCICDVCGEEMDASKVYLKGLLMSAFLKGHKSCLISYDEEEKEDE